jgi:hypothetical protein
LAIFLLVSLSQVVDVAIGFQQFKYIPRTTFSRTVSSSSSSSSSRLYAENKKETPQYQKYDAVLQKSELVGKGNYLLHVDYSAHKYNDLGYQPGHVLALEIQPRGSSEEEGSSQFTTMNEKTVKDLKINDGWLRGPYTVSRSTPDGFQILIREVGYKSHVLATSPQGTPLKFGGKFKVPIVEGVVNNVELEGFPNTDRVVLISTGVGIGPCVGAIELLLNDTSYDGKIDLFGCFRNREDIALSNDLDSLASSSKRFTWTPILSSEDTGRISANEEQLIKYLQSDNEGTCSIRSTHYHLIGNGQMVNEWKAGLEKAGVPKQRVTVEAYFNTFSETDPNVIDTIASAVEKVAATSSISQTAPS